MTGSGSSEFKDRLRADCRAALLENREWRRQDRDVLRKRVRRRIRVSIRWLIAIAVGAAIGAALSHQADDGRMSSASIGLAIASLLLVLHFIASQWLWHLCHADRDLVAFALLPVPDRWIVHRQVRKWAVMIWPGAIICVAVMVALGTGATSGWRLDTGSLLGGVSLSGLMGALAVCAIRQRWLNHILFPICVFGWLGMIILRNFELFWNNFMPWLNAHADQLAWFLPTAWVIRPVQEFFQGGPYSSFPLLFPAAALVWFAWWEMRLLIARLRPREVVLIPYAAQLPEDMPAEVEEEFHVAIDRPPDTEDEEASALLRSRAFLEPCQPPADWITRIVWYSWSARERLLAEWAGSCWNPWSHRWLWGAGWMLLGFIAGWLSKPSYPYGWIFAWLLPTVVSLLLLLPCRMAWQRWAQSGSIGSGSTLWTNLLPVSVPELVRMDRKLAFVRMLIAVPVILLGGLGLTWLAEVETHEALTGAMLTAILSLGVRPVMLAMHLSNQQSSKSMGVQCADLLMLGMTLVAAGLAIASSIGVIVSGNHKMLMLVPAGLALLVCDLVGRLSIRLWSKRRLNAVSLGHE